MHQPYRSCIEACNLCADACDHCATACLTEPDVAMMSACIRLDLDCTAICRLASGAMSRRSELAHEICKLCAEACDACAAECGRHPYDHCQACAEACRRCADECRAMVGSAHPGRTVSRARAAQ